jgi:hypothetical protein
MNEKIKRKIEQMLKMSEPGSGCTKEEADTARIMAEKLMGQYNLSVDTIYFATDSFNVPTGKWQKVLFHTCCKCNSVFEINCNTHITMYGKSTNIFLAKELYTYVDSRIQRASHSMSGAWKLIMEEEKCDKRKAMSIERQERNDFEDGAYAEINARIRTSPAWAIDMEEINEAKEYAVTEGVKWRKGRGGKLGMGSSEGRGFASEISLARQTGGGISSIRQIGG